MRTRLVVNWKQEKNTHNWLIVNTCYSYLIMKDHISIPLSKRISTKYRLILLALLAIIHLLSFQIVRTYLKTKEVQTEFDYFFLSNPEVFNVRKRLYWLVIFESIQYAVIYAPELMPVLFKLYNKYFAASSFLACWR